MRRLSAALLLSALPFLSADADAQRGRNAGPRGAEFFLARTGELRLTDAQVVRLAAIARRTADRRRAMRVSMDSLTAGRRPGVRPDSAERAARTRNFEQMRARFDREREQERADLRDALAVLTPEQQAMAWEMVARGGPIAQRVRRARSRGEQRRGGGPGYGRERRRERQAPQPSQRPPA
jgi:Spy/CpxP family protein refolding chaperone